MSDNLLAVFVLTFNSANVIEKTATAALSLSPLVVIIDSGSNDNTVEIATQMGCQVHRRAFLHYGDQRNWAIEAFREIADWQLHLDADEVLDELAIRALRTAIENPGPHDGFLLRRRTYFMGEPLRFGGAMSWHLRLFRSHAGRCEDRLYDQHFICRGSTTKIRRGFIHDMNVASLSEWTIRHNRWSDAEAAELTRRDGKEGQLAGRLSNDPRERRRYYKGLYYRSPKLVRGVAYFFFRYIALGGFLDGRTGFVYAALQAFWFRVLVDAKLIEMEVRSVPERKD